MPPQQESTSALDGHDASTASPGKGHPSKVHITIEGTTYDCTKWLKHHPGGDLLQLYHGQDASDAFSALHALSTRDRLQNLPVLSAEEVAATKREVVDVGHAADRTARDDAILADYTKLTQELRDEGLFDSSYVWYTYKTVTTIGLFGVAFGMAKAGWYTFAALVMALGYQQHGWLAHEYLHHQVFKNRSWNDAMALLIGNVMQGYSGTWWRSRHDAHHAATNVLADPDVNFDFTGDCDIDNLPLLAWSTYDVNRTSLGSLKTMRYQAWYFIPFCFFLRIIWCIHSFQTVLELKEHHNSSYRRRYKWEMRTIVAHYVLKALFLYACMPSLWQAVQFEIISEMVGGFFTAIVVFENHYPLDKQTGKNMNNWVDLQVEGTLNITPGIVNDWFFGGLNYQIEHHLWPSLPRHNLSAIRPRVMALCEKHGVQYRCYSMTQGVGLILGYLSGIADVMDERLGKEKTA